MTQIRQRARAHLQKGKFDKAIEEYKRLTGMETKNPNYFNELGDIYLKAGDSIQAVSSFEKAVVNYEKVALYNNAVAVCKKILRIVPDRGDTLYKLGELRAKQKLGGEARVYFSQFLDHILANADSCGPEMNEKIDGILELVSENAEILEKAADALVIIGIKTGGLEIYSKLIGDARRSGENGRTAAIEMKIDLLKKSMTSDEIELVEKAMASQTDEDTAGCADGQQAPPADEASPEAGEAEEPPPVEVEGEPAVEEEIPSDESEPEIDGEESVDMEAPGFPETDEEAVPEADEEAAPDDEEETVYTVDDVEPYAEPEPDDASVEVSPDGEEVPADMEEPESEAPVEEAAEEVPVDEAGGEEPRDEEEIGDAGGSDIGEEEAVETADEAPSGRKEDLSSLLDDVRHADTTESLVEEITSDVEEDDFRSHYDLGMAYLEMALYTEAIKEFQVASRSEQIQIKSIEMIGHCFIMQNNPRLAVKQLLRGLEIVKVANSESLGVHYNLGLAYEMLGELEKAREHYEEVYIVDISFRDIAEKMKKLSTVS